MGKDTFSHDSILGGINMIKRRNNRLLLEVGEKPPYPIIIDNPCFKDIFVNLNKADLGIVLFFTLMGIPTARFVINSPFTNEYLRRFAFKQVYGFSIQMGMSLALLNSCYRLQGLVDNGLQWKRKENRLRKYDFTSEYEKKSLWGFLRIRDY